MRKCYTKDAKIDPPIIATHLSVSERIQLAEAMYEEVLYFQKRKLKPFWKSFPSFEALEKWKKKQKDPLLW